MARRKQHPQSNTHRGRLSWLTRLPFFSLLLLLISYALLGWYVAEPPTTWHNWLAIGGAIVLIALALVSPATQIRRFFGAWLQSNATAFSSIAVFAFMAVIILTRLDLFAQWLILLAPGLLVRLDLQIAGYGDWQAFSTITTICLTGYGTGLMARQLLGI